MANETATGYQFKEPEQLTPTLEQLGHALNEAVHMQQNILTRLEALNGLFFGPSPEQKLASDSAKSSGGLLHSWSTRLNELSVLQHDAAAELAKFEAAIGGDL